jgi:hypothetical protein
MSQRLLPTAQGSSPAIHCPSAGSRSCSARPPAAGDYAAAWRLLGSNPQGGGYASFVGGYADTGTQMVTEVSASGDQVSFTLTSDNPDGIVQTHAGTDTVTGGRIIHASVTQTG